MRTPAFHNPFGDQLRDWRRRRRLSQLELASRAGVSSRHLSFVETGRARPSREMVLHLAEELDVPLLDRNALLVAAGHAPVYRQTPIDAPEMEDVRRTLDLVVSSHEPFPAYVADRHWNVVTFNRAVVLLAEGADPSLLEPPVNVLRLCLHPEGLARKVVNFEDYSAHLLGRLRRQVEISGDPGLTALYGELRHYPGVSPTPATPGAQPGPTDVALPVRIRSRLGDLSFFLTVTTFGTAIDVTLDDLVIESLFPADEATATLLTEQAL